MLWHSFSLEDSSIQSSLSDAVTAGGNGLSATLPPQGGSRQSPEESQQTLPPLLISAAVKDHRQDEGALLTFQTSKMLEVFKKLLY